MFIAEISTILVLGIIFSFFGLGALLCLLFTLAVYALPFFVAVTAGMAAFHSGTGVIGAILVAAVVGGATTGQWADRVRDGSLPDDPRRGRSPIRRAGYNRRLQRHPCAG